MEVNGIVSIVLVIFYVLILLIGWKNGVIKHIASVLATLLAIPAAFLLSPVLIPILSPVLEGWLTNVVNALSVKYFSSLPEVVLEVIGSAMAVGIASVAKSLVRICAFVIAMIVLNIVLGKIAKIRDLKLVGLVDHLLGLAFSAVSAVLVTWIFQTIFIMLHLTGNQWTEAILTNPLFLKICEFNLFL